MLANLTTDEKDAIKILDYWFIMEFLNQQSLKKYKEKETSALTYKKQLLEDLILQMTGKTVEVEMLLKKTNMHQDLAEISVDDILKQTVHMNIVVEEEPEDE